MDELNYAIKYDLLDVVKDLVEKYGKKIITKGDDVKLTPLCNAIYCERINIVEYFLSLDDYSKYKNVLEGTADTLNPKLITLALKHLRKQEDTYLIMIERCCININLRYLDPLLPNKEADLLPYIPKYDIVTDTRRFIKCLDILFPHCSLEPVREIMKPLREFLMEESHKLLELQECSRIIEEYLCKYKV